MSVHLCAFARALSCYLLRPGAAECSLRAVVLPKSLSQMDSGTLVAAAALRKEHAEGF